MGYVFDLRGVLSELQVAHVQQQVSFSMLTDFENYSVFKPAEVHASVVGTMFSQLETWTAAMRDVRNLVSVA